MLPVLHVNGLIRDYQPGADSDALKKAMSRHARDVVGGTLDVDHYVANFDNLVVSGLGFGRVLHDELGPIAFFGGIVVIDWVTGGVIAQEVVWAADESRHSGVRTFSLVADFEEQARRRGATRVVIPVPDNPDKEVLARYYARRGYRPQETLFVKSL